jgi:ABC-2 type transport system permease protein
MDATITIWSKHMMKFARNREESIGLALQSLLWVVLFGVGMRALIPDAPGGDYMSFVVPGIIALSALSGAVGGGTVLLDERLRGIMKEYLAAPIPRLSILMGNAASTTTKALIQALIIVVVGALMGARFTLNPLGWLAALVLLVLFSLGFAALALAVAARTSSMMGYHGLIFLLNLPVLFASNALYPLAILPTWMQIITLINPATYAIDGLRATAFGAPAALPLGLSLAVLVGFCALSVWLALLSFRSVTR